MRSCTTRAHSSLQSPPDQRWSEDRTPNDRNDNQFRLLVVASDGEGSCDRWYLRTFSSLIRCSRGDLAEVDQVVICSPDKDLSQCVQGDRVVVLDRRKKVMLNAEGIVEKFGVFPQSLQEVGMEKTRPPCVESINVRSWEKRACCNVSSGVLQTKRGSGRSAFR